MLDKMKLLKLILAELLVSQVTLACDNNKNAAENNSDKNEVYQNPVVAKSLPDPTIINTKTIRRAGCSCSMKCSGKTAGRMWMEIPRPKNGKNLNLIKLVELGILSINQK
jgi:hypothetical protein